MVNVLRIAPKVENKADSKLLVKQEKPPNPDPKEPEKEAVNLHGAFQLPGSNNQKTDNTLETQKSFKPPGSRNSKNDELPATQKMFKLPGARDSAKKASPAASKGGSDTEPKETDDVPEDIVTITDFSQQQAISIC